MAAPTASTAQMNCRVDKPKKIVSLCCRTSLGILISIYLPPVEMCLKLSRISSELIYFSIF